MLRVARIVATGEWQGTPAGSVTLDYNDRHRRRRVMVAEGGTRFLLDLPRPVTLTDGDALELDDGRIIVVRAAAEPLVEIRAESGQELARYAWHVGNRHVPAQILPDRLRLRADSVIVDMLRGQGAEVAGVSAPFEPEGGAYAHSTTHHHDRVD